MILLAVLLPSIAMARTPLFKEEQKPASVAEVAQKQRNGSSRSHGSSWSNVVQGNPIVLPAQPVARELETLLPGELQLARIKQSVLAFNEGKAPVAANLTDERGRDIILIGEATLEKNSKRILVDFRIARLESSSELFDFKGVAMDGDGTLGLEGDYQSGKPKFFAAELAAAAAAGFADASVNRPTNAFGNQQEERSLDTSGKKAIGSALARTADRFAEKVRQAPEYSVLKGPAAIQVLVLEPPRRKL
ncbi:MAG: hypothetical protein IPJ84_15400 [Bdellovibrionales bacterium]|nr:hypothetical protein [Bdellovibrionales bacterium]